MTNPQVVAARLMGIEVLCGHCKHYDHSTDRGDGVICEAACDFVGAQRVYFYMRPCSRFVLKPSREKSGQ